MAHMPIKKEISFALDTLESPRSRRLLSKESTPAPAPVPTTTVSTSTLTTGTTTTAKTTLYTGFSNLRSRTVRIAETTKESLPQKPVATSTTGTSTDTVSENAVKSISTQTPLPLTMPTSVLASLITSQLTTTDASNKPANGCYTNWSSNHTTLAAQPWCAMSDLMYFCDKYEFKSLVVCDTKTHQQIVAEVRALLAGQAPFGQRQRFPADIRNPENLWVCIGRCAGVEYHLNRILNAFRKPLDQLSPEKQRASRQNFHLAVNELRLDISARITEVRLYDRTVFERDFHLSWQDDGK